MSEEQVINQRRAQQGSLNVEQKGCKENGELDTGAAAPRQLQSSLFPTCCTVHVTSETINSKRPTKCINDNKMMIFCSSGICAITPRGQTLTFHAKIFLGTAGTIDSNSDNQSFSLGFNSTPPAPVIFFKRYSSIQNPSTLFWCELWSFRDIRCREVSPLSNIIKLDSAKFVHFKNSTAVTHSKNRDPVTRDNGLLKSFQWNLLA